MQTGVPPEQALMVLVPEAYRNHPDLMKKYPEVRTGVFEQSMSPVVPDN